MRRLIVLGMLLFGALALVIGCSDDDEGTPVGGLTQGDTADLSFQFIDTTVGEDIFSNMGISIELAFSLMDWIPGASAGLLRDNPITTLGTSEYEDIIITSVIFTYTESGWFVFEFDALIVELPEYDTTEISGIDSLQFLNNGVIIDTSAVDPEMDEFKIRGHAQWSHADDASGATHHRIDIETQESGVDTLMLINAAGNDTLSLSLATDSANCTLDVYNTLAVTNLLVAMDDEEDGCPQSGRVSVAATVDLSCIGGSQNPFDHLDINHTWVITLVFNDNGTVTMTYSDGTTLWTVTRVCNEM